MAELSEFVAAQDAVWPEVVAELGACRKRTHWIWFVFPQLKTLGRSPTAVHFGLSGIEEAAAYLDHPVLGRRLEEVAGLVLRCAGRDPAEMFGTVDALKVRSSMTLFEAVQEAPAIFREVLDSVYASERCPLTEAALHP